MRLHTLLEANVEPKGLDYIEKFIHEIGEDLEASNPGINHTAFLKRLRKDIINNNIASTAPNRNPATVLKPYKPKKTDPDYIKNASDVYTINAPAFADMHNNILDLFVPDDGEPTINPLFYKFHNLVKDAKTLDPHIANKLLPIKKKYEQGKFDLQGVTQAMQIMTQLGAQKWKHDSAERRRLETEAPIIMKFKNGSKWVRLDSQEEMKREGDMMQNCISGYCPVGEQGDLTLGLRDTFNAEVEPADQTDDEAYEWLLQWLEENDTDVQDFIMNKMDDGLDPQLSAALEDVLNMDEEQAFEWMVDQIIEADVDIETGETYDGHLVYSLRDKHGESHVSAEYDPNMDMNYPEPEEALGKQNKPPVEKYAPYIEKLNDFFAEHPETFGPKGNTLDMPFHPDYDDQREHNESIINRMKPSVRQAILEAKTNGYLYHATFTKNVPNIVNKGLLQFQPSLWIKGPGGSRYNEEAGIFAFDNPKDALNWGGKMEWEFRDDDKDISIVRIDMEEFWGDDPAEDPFIAQHGRSMRSAQNIKADKIIDAIKLDDLGRPGDLGISRDEWLDQSSKVLSESVIVEAKEKLTLAKLPYAKNALAPVMSKKTLDYHYSGLAKAYVDKFNSGEGDAKFNEAGAFLHNIFFPQLQAPTSGNKPSGASLDLINNKYGSFDKFKEEFTNTAMGIQGSGWIYMTKSGTIKIIKNHAIRTDIAMLVDWWEHAWVLDYEKDKGKYCANFWRIINWDIVNEKLGQVIKEGKETSNWEKWDQAMEQKYGSEWEEITDGIRDHYESSAWADHATNTNNIIKIRKEHPSFTNYSGINKIYRVVRKDGNEPMSNKYVSYSWDREGVETVMRSFERGSGGVTKSDFVIIEKDFNASDAILNFSNMIEFTHRIKDGYSSDFYNREHEVWMKRTPYYTTHEDSEVIDEGKLPKGHRNYKKQMAAIHANEDVKYDFKENTYPEIEFVCANDEYCDATDPEAQNALWNDLRSVKGIVSYKQDWSHDDPVGNPVSMAVIIKEPEALDIIRGLAGKHGVEIDLDSIERRNEKYLDTLASGETPYVVDVMFHEDTNKQLRNIGQHMQNKAWLSAQDRVGPGDQDMAVGAEERFNRGMGGMMKKIGSGKLDSITNKELANTKTASTDYAAELRSRLKKMGEDAAGVGIITKQNTTADVKKGETKRQAAKFGNKFPPSKHK